VSVRLTVAALQQRISQHTSWRAYSAAQRARVEAAVRQGAQLLVFPEYGAIEAASIGGEAVYGDLARELEVALALHDPVLALHQDLAREFGVWILAPSLPTRDEARVINRAYLLGEGQTQHQDKQLMTRFEAESWGISPGGPLRPLQTPWGLVGVCICYDVEFPKLARCLVEQGAEFLLAPSCTDGLAGYHRVRIGAQARALENQRFVVHAATVGDAPWSAALDTNVGAAAIYAPPDPMLCPDGVVAQGPLNAPDLWVVAELNLDSAAAVRQGGQVLNDRDWDLQP
jgi:predicted amidohydrolase